MNKKYLLKTNFWFLGKGYKAGTEITLSPEEIRDYRIKNLLRRGLLVPVEEPKEEEAIIEEKEIEEKKIWDTNQKTNIETLTSVKGVGDALAGRILDVYPYEHLLREDTAEEISEKVSGVSVRLAKMTKEAIK